MEYHKATLKNTIAACLATADANYSAKKVAQLIGLDPTSENLRWVSEICHAVATHIVECPRTYTKFYWIVL